MICVLCTERSMTDQHSNISWRRQSSRCNGWRDWEKAVSNDRKGLELVDDRNTEGQPTSPSSLTEIMY